MPHDMLHYTVSVDMVPISRVQTFPVFTGNGPIYFHCSVSLDMLPSSNLVDSAPAENLLTKATDVRGLSFRYNLQFCSNLWYQSFFLQPRRSEKLFGTVQARRCWWRDDALAVPRTAKFKANPTPDQWLIAWLRLLIIPDMREEANDLRTMIPLDINPEPRRKTRGRKTGMKLSPFSLYCLHFINTFVNQVLRALTGSEWCAGFSSSDNTILVRPHIKTWKNSGLLAARLPLGFHGDPNTLDTPSSKRIFRSQRGVPQLAFFGSLLMTHLPLKPAENNSKRNFPHSGNFVRESFVRDIYQTLFSFTEAGAAGGFANSPHICHLMLLAENDSTASWTCEKASRVFGALFIEVCHLCLPQQTRNDRLHVRHFFLIGHGNFHTKHKSLQAVYEIVRQSDNTMNPSDIQRNKNSHRCRHTPNRQHRPK